MLIWIRPNESFTKSHHFQFHLLTGSRITLTNAALEFHRIEFIEHNQSRITTDVVIHLISNSTLILNVNISLLFDLLFIDLSILLSRIIYSK